MNKYIIDNANWLDRYNQIIELQKLKELPFIKQLMNKNEEILVADVGCGNGRSIRTIKSVFPQASIIAIDIVAGNIEYVNSIGKGDTVKTIISDAKEYFSKSQSPIFDLVLFSWSFFEMGEGVSGFEKNLSLECLIENVKTSLKDNGYIVVLQPTKGGSFEKLLSLFMPSSDEIYTFAHNFLLSYGFCGPKVTCPCRSDELAIWSTFEYQTDQELFEGIASIIFLETGKTLSYEEFETKLNVFKKNYEITNNGYHMCLTDCVNIYYYNKAGASVK